MHIQLKNLVIFSHRTSQVRDVGIIVNEMKVKGVVIQPLVWYHTTYRKEREREKESECVHRCEVSTRASIL